MKCPRKWLKSRRNSDIVKIFCFIEIRDHKYFTIFRMKYMKYIYFIRYKSVRPSPTGLVVAR